MLAACLNSAEESPDPKQDKNGNTFPGQIAQMTAISAMNPPRSLAAGGATTLLAGGSQHHYQPALPHSLQFMQDNLSGIWNQCPMSHRRIPETARANLIVSSVGSPGKYHQMCGRANRMPPSRSGFGVDLHSPRKIVPRGRPLEVLQSAENRRSNLISRAVPKGVDLETTPMPAGRRGPRARSTYVSSTDVCP